MASASTSQPPPSLATSSPSSSTTRPPRPGRRPRGSTVFNKDIDFLFKRVGITRNMVRSLPPYQEKAVPIFELPIPQRRALLRVFNKCVREIANMLYPSDSETLFKELSEKKNEKLHVGQSLVHAMQSARKGSLERRIIRACLCASYPGQEVQRLLNEANAKNCTVTDDDNDNDNDNDDDDAEGNSNNDQPADDNDQSPSNNKSTTNDQSNNDNNDNPDGDMNESAPKNTSNDSPKEPALKRLKLSGGFRRTYSVGRADWNTLIAHGSLPGLAPRGSKRTVARGDDDMIRHALRFIFKSENLHLVSCGVYRLRINGHLKDFPLVYRRLYQDVEQLWKNYISEIQSNNPQQRHYCRTVFLAFVKKFTHGQIRKRGSADYIPEFLLDKNFRLIERVVENEVNDTNVSKQLLEKARELEDYLRFTYSTHIDSVDPPNDPFHSTDFALLCHDPNTGAEPKTSNCKQCLRPFQLLNDIQRSITNIRQDIVDVLCDAREKILLYMGHKQRGALQDRKVASVFEQLQHHDPGKAAVIMINFNMRFEGICYKHGVMAHSSAIFYRTGDSRPLHPLQNGTQPQPIPAQPNGAPCELSTMFVDHVPGNDTVQDAESVCQIIDALFARLKLEMPQLHQVWLISDDAKHYQNELTPVLLPFIAHYHGFQLNGFINSETVLGHSLGDAHFSIAKRLIRKYCIEKRRDIAVPTDLINALSYVDGVANSCVELVNISRDGTNLKPWLKARQTRKLAKLFRVTEVEYGMVSGDKVTASCFKIAGGPGRKFEFGRHYSKEIFTSVDSINGSGDVPSQVLNQMDMSNDVIFGTNDPNGHADSDLNYYAPQQLPPPPPTITLPVLAPLQTQPQPQAEEQSDGALPPPPPIDSTANRRRDTKFRGQETDVVVWTRSKCVLEVVRGKVFSRSAVDDAVSLIEREKDSYDEAECGDGGDENESSVRCAKCGQVGNVTSPSWGDNNGDRDRTVLNRATVLLKGMIDSGDVMIRERTTQGPFLSSIVLDMYTVTVNRLQAGWGRRIQNGLTHGRNFVSEYVADITELHNHGLQTCGKGTSAKVIQEGLQKRYPKRYDIPSEYHINVMIASIRKSISATLPAGSQNPGGPGRARKMPLHYAERIREMVLNDRTMMPRDGRARLVQLLNLNPDFLPEDFPDDHSIRCTMSSLKTVLNKQ